MVEEDQDVKRLEILQSMIDIYAERLVDLRTKCFTGNELTQNEIRTLEGKLIKLFSQYVIRVKLRDRINAISGSPNIPSLEQWLQVVGLCQSCIQNACLKEKTLESLLESPQYKLKNFLSDCSQLEEEYRRLSTALKNLKRYIDILTENKNEASNTGLETTSLHWDSWNGQSAAQLVSYATLNTQLNGNYSTHGEQSALNIQSGPSTTPPILSPPLTPVHKIKQEKYVPKSPGSVSDHCRSPLLGRNQNVQEGKSEDPCKSSGYRESPSFNVTSCNGKSLIGDNFTFPCENGGNMIGTNRRARLPTIPDTEHSSPATSLYSSPSRSSPIISSAPSYSVSNSLSTVTSDSSPSRATDFSSSLAASVMDSPSGRNYFTTFPRSPKTSTSLSGVMVHDIGHRFTKRFSFNRPCDYCCKPIIMNTGLKCKECRYRCHIDCESKVPRSCGLPEEFITIFKSFVDNSNHHSSVINSSGVESSPSTLRHMPGSSHPSPTTRINDFISHLERRGGSDSATSSHSSAPSSPALFTLTNQQISASASPIPNSKQKFDFSIDVINPDTELCSSLHSDHIDSSSTTNETLYDNNVNREDSQDSQNWDNECVDKVWPRQYSVSMKEWEIPWDELKMGEKLGTGHFGTVYSGYWHGDVAVKVLDMDYSADAKMWENFKSEVSTFRKTRHDNLVLFMGACMKPPRLAIVTSMVQGITLYKYIHLRRDKFSMAKTIIIAQQISQGMGYLHAKNIVHKDLRTKNIFLEKERVKITDFGLFSVTKQCYRNRTQDGLIIPPGWLCYLAPELMRSLKVHIKPDDEHLPFSKASDVYAFGTVWYELLCGEWPFTTQDPEAVIWQVGKGMKPSLPNLEASRDVKDILMQCWAYSANRRPDFTSLLKTLEKLPKKKLARSPSHPVHLSRSAESMF
ncbi:hypothetical protein V9T40_014396 [Parthenolecanium corni]|uniref:Kinase suppressor of Ras 2 n=1 Tax=Parthenolecanium corni TaxID=536013 RepID=A0AAN9T724_9HEMI